MNTTPIAWTTKTGSPAFIRKVWQNDQDDQIEVHGHVALSRRSTPWWHVALVLTPSGLFQSADAQRASREFRTLAKAKAAAEGLIRERAAAKFRNA